MDLRQIVQALQDPSSAKMRADGLATLYNYNDPLTDKEAAALAEYNRSVIEQVEGGLKVDEAPADIAAMATHPLHAVNPLAVIQCVVAAAKVPCLPRRLQRTLHKRLLPLLAARTPLTTPEWCAALHMASTSLPIADSRAALRCLEAIVELAAPGILFPERPAVTFRYIKKVPRRESAAPKLKEFTAEEARLLLLKAAARVLQRYAQIHSAIAKHSVKGIDTASDEEVFLRSGPIRRLQAAVAMPNTADAGVTKKSTTAAAAAAEADAAAAIAALQAAVKKLAPADAVTVAALWPSVLTVSKDQIVAAVKASPGVINAVTGAGARCLPGCLTLESPEEVVQACLYNMGLSTTSTAAAFCDLTAVLLAAPAHAAAFIAARGKDPVGQLLTPFVNSARVLTPAVALLVAPQLAELFRRMYASTLAADNTTATTTTTALVHAFLQATAFVVGTRCRSSQEKGSVMAVMASALAALPAEVYSNEGVIAAAKAELAVVLRREVAVPAVEATEQALRIVAILRVEELVRQGLVDAVKNARRSGEESIRRALLVHLVPSQTPADVVAELVTGLLEECVEVETARPDAFLALYFVAAADPSRAAALCPLLSTADVLGQLGGATAAAAAGAANGNGGSDVEPAVRAARRRYELTRAAAVAVALADVAAAPQYGPLAMLLTSASGQLRTPLAAYVATKVNRAAYEALPAAAGGGEAAGGDPVAAAAMWSSLVTTVFGLNSAALAAEGPRILSASAADAVAAIGGAVLSHWAHLPCAATTLAEVFTCCGHDNTQGEDPYFYSPNGRPQRLYHESQHTVNDRAVRRLFRGECGSLPNIHAVEVATVLVGTTTTAAGTMSAVEAHRSTAACRALALLLTRVKPAASEAVFSLFAGSALCHAAAYLKSLDAKDRAIAAEDAGAMAVYENEAMKELNLLKVHPDKAPKGTSQDDFDDMKRGHRVALEKALEALRADVARRTLAIAPAVRANKAPFLAARLIGTNGVFDSVGIAVLYPCLQGILNESTGGGGAATDVVVVPAVLATLAGDAIVGLLACTPLRAVSTAMAAVVARLHTAPTLAVRDVGQISTIVTSLRQALAHMLPAAYFVILSAFAWIAFRAGRGGNAVSTTIPVATQHQLLGVLLQNVGQAGLPQPTEAMQLLAFIIKSFPALYKSVQQGVQTLMPLVPAEHLPVIEACMFESSGSVREVTAGALGRFAHFKQCRRGLVLAYVFAKDSSLNVARHCTAIMADERYEFTLTASSDWGDLTYFLKAYGGVAGNAERIALAMKVLFAECKEAGEKMTGGSTPEQIAQQQSAWVGEVVAVGGLAAVVTLQVLTSTFVGDVFTKAVDFLCSLTERLDTGEALMRTVLSAGRIVLRGADLAVLRRIAPDLQARLAKPPKDATPAHREQYLATSTVWLTIISCRLQETELLEAIVEQQSRVLNNSTSAMVHRCVSDAMVEICKNEHVRNSPKLDEFVDKCIKQVISSGSYIKKKAHAWGLVGVLQGLGISSIRRYNIVAVIDKAGHEKQTEKSGAMVMLEVLCDVLGAKFEPYALSQSQLLLESVADPDPKISECADDASRVMMKNLSGVGLRQLIPRLVTSLTAEQAKKRVPPLNFIGYVAFCSPKELAATLPEIMRHVIACLFDVNNAVSVAAYNALRRVAGVVSNPEIQEHVEMILKALRSPSSDTENALDALLYTRFINVIDPASLALIIPVISRGLGQQSAHTRPKAAQIVASMVTLVNDPRSLKPYADDLVRLLEEASQDPLTETRTTSAKAIGALAAAIGGSLVDTITNWAFAILQKTSSGAIEKAGAAQVFVELVSNCGDELLQSNFATIEAGMTDDKPAVREGFLYIMVYAPATLSSESFQNLLPIAFPWVLEGLSHYADKVREVALVAGDSIIALYGTRNLTLVLEPLLDGVVSEVSTLRHSSLMLSSKLLLHLVAHIKKKIRIQAAMDAVANEDREALAAAIGADADSGNNDDNGEGEGGLTMEAARDVEKRGVSILGALEEMLGTDHFVRLLSAIFCGRNEHSLTVRNDTNMAWQACVASIRAAVGKIFDSLVRLLMHFGASDNPDCQEAAEKTIEFTCRMNETIERFVDCFCEAYKEDGAKVKLGALNSLATVVQYADSKKLISMGGQIVGCVLPGMQHEDEAIQEAARVVFGCVSRTVGSRLIEGAVEAQLTTSVRGVVEVVKVKPSTALALVFKHLNALTEYTDANLELIDSILDVEEAEDDLRKYNDDIIKLLLAFLVQGLEGATDTAVKYVDMMPREFENILVEQFQRAMNLPAKRHGALLLAEALGLGTPTDNIDGLTAVFRAVVSCLGDDDEELRADAVRILPDLFTSLEDRVTDELDDEAREDVTMSKRASGRYQLQFLDVFKDTLAVTARASVSEASPEFAVLGEGEPRLFDVLMAFYNRGLDYGTPMQKVEAVECIQDVMAFAPRSISAAAANTVAGRCSKVLFTRNDGSVVLSLVQLCLQLLNYPASGKEKMVEGTMALAMFNAALCDSGEARVLALRIVIQLLQRSEKYADLILGTIVTKKAAVDTPLFRTVMCRFLSVVVRYAGFEKAFPHIGRLMDTVLPTWESADSPAQAAAAGVAVGALCKSASITEERLGDIKERTLAVTSTKGSQALAGFALVYSLITAAPGRTDQSFLEVAAEHLAAAASFGASDKLTAMWLLRAAAAVASTGCVPQATFRPEAYLPLLRKINSTDEQGMSTSQFFFDCVTGAYPTTYAILEPMPREHSYCWNTVGNFDADLDDEADADTVY